MSATDYSSWKTIELDLKEVQSTLTKNQMRLVSLSPDRTAKRKNVKSRFAQGKRKISSFKERMVRDLKLQEQFSKESSNQKAMVVEISKNDSRYQEYAKKLGLVFSKNSRRAFSPPPVLRFLAIKSSMGTRKLIEDWHRNLNLPALSSNNESTSDEFSPKTKILTTNTMKNEHNSNNRKFKRKSSLKIENPRVARVKKQTFHDLSLGVGKANSGVCSPAFESVLNDSSFEKPFENKNFLQMQRRKRNLESLLTGAEIASMRRKIMRDIRSPKPKNHHFTRFDL